MWTLGLPLCRFAVVTPAILVGCGGGSIDLDGPGNFDPNHLLEVAIEIDEDDWDALRHETRSFLTEFTGDCRAAPFENPYTTFHASIEIDGESIGDVGIRKKGFIGSQSTVKPGLKINVDEFIDGAELFGVDNITLNNAVQDPSLIRQCIGYDLFRSAGINAPRCNFAHVSVNGTELGIYSHVEPIKPAFLRSTFGSDHGNLYEATLSDFREGWFSTFEPKTDDTDPTLSRIKSLSTALESGEALEDVLEDHIDVEQYLSFWAMESITGHWDGHTGNTNNFFVYEDPQIDRLVFIPWGLDDVLDPEFLERGPFAESVIPYKMLEDPSLTARLEERVHELLDTTWKEEKLLSNVDQIVDLLSSRMDTSAIEEDVDSVRKYIRTRRDALVSELPGEPGELMGLGCLHPIASAEGEFSTTWDTLENEDITASGTVDLTVVWDGYPVEFEATGCAAGVSEEEDPLLVFFGYIDPDEGAYVLPYLVFDPSMVEVGEALPIDNETVGGALLYTDNSLYGELTTAGYLHNGTLTFDAFSEQAGKPVSGYFQTEIYAWEE